MRINLSTLKRSKVVLGDCPRRCCLWLCVVLPAWCTPSAWADWHGKLSFLSEYVYRGYSKSWGNPALQGQLDYRDDTGWFTGVALSQASFDGRNYPEHTDLEVKPFLGMQWSMASDWRTEWSAHGYVYDGKVFNKSADFVEFSAALHYQDWLSGKVSVAPNAYQRQATIDYELSYRRDLSDTVQLSGGLGFYQAGRLLGEDYLYWNLGVSWFLDTHLALDFRYVDAQINGNYAGGWRSGAFHPKPMTDNYLLSISVGF